MTDPQPTDLDPDHIDPDGPDLAANDEDDDPLTHVGIIQADDQEYMR